MQDGIRPPCPAPPGLTHSGRTSCASPATGSPRPTTLGARNTDTLRQSLRSTCKKKSPRQGVGPQPGGGLVGVGPLWLPSPVPSPRRWPENLQLGCRIPSQPSNRVWKPGVRSWAPDSLHYLPEVLTAVADAAGTARPPRVQPGQPHQPGVQLVAHGRAEAAPVGGQHLWAQEAVGTRRRARRRRGAPTPHAVLTILPSPEPKSTVFPGRPRSSDNTCSTCRALAPTYGTCAGRQGLVPEREPRPPAPPAPPRPGSGRARAAPAAAAARAGSRAAAAAPTLRRRPGPIPPPPAAAPARPAAARAAPPAPRLGRPAPWPPTRCSGASHRAGPELTVRPAAPTRPQEATPEVAGRRLRREPEAAVHRRSGRGPGPSPRVPGRGACSPLPFPSPGPARSLRPPAR